MGILCIKRIGPWHPKDDPHLACILILELVALQEVQPQIEHHLHPQTSFQWKREFSDTNFEIRNLAEISTECFSLHQGEGSAC